MPPCGSSRIVVRRLVHHVVAVQLAAVAVEAVGAEIRFLGAGRVVAEVGVPVLRDHRPGGEHDLAGAVGRRVVRGSRAGDGLGFRRSPAARPGRRRPRAAPGTRLPRWNSGHTPPLLSGRGSADTGPGPPGRSASPAPRGRRSAETRVSRSASSSEIWTSYSRGTRDFPMDPQLVQFDRAAEVDLQPLRLARRPPLAQRVFKLPSKARSGRYSLA